MFVPARLTAFTLGRPKVEQIPIENFQSFEVSGDNSRPAVGDGKQVVSIILRGGGVVEVVMDRSEDALAELHALLSATATV